MTRSKLCLSVRRISTLEAAWRHVRTRGLSSSNEDIQIETRRFDQNAVQNLRAIHETLRHKTFSFSPQKGVVKKRSKKAGRPIVVSPIPNRIVQRAILTVSEDITAIRDVLNVPTSFGGITGADTAIALVIEKISSGATWFIRSDIPNFFSHIPKRLIVEFIRKATNDEQFVELFERAITVELANAAALKEQNLYEIFPIGPIGVAQGSALSPLVGNILLRDFDSSMNGLGISCIRYIDDFIILGPSKHKVDTAFKSAKRKLAELGLDAYDPEVNPEKAERGLCVSGFDFLGCHISNTRIIPCKKARQAILTKIESVYEDGKRAIAFANRGKKPGALSQRFAQSHAKVDRIVKGWGESFAFCNDRRPVLELDKRISEVVKDFNTKVRQIMRGADSATMRRTIGVTLLEDIRSKPLTDLGSDRHTKRFRKTIRKV